MTDPGQLWGTQALRIYGAYYGEICLSTLKYTNQEMIFGMSLMEIWYVINGNLVHDVNDKMNLPPLDLFDSHILRCGSSSRQMYI